MKNAVISMFLLATLISSPYAVYAIESEDYATTSEVGFLVQMLVDHGVLTREQAQQELQKAKKLEEGWASARQKEMEKIMRSLMDQPGQESSSIGRWREQDGPSIVRRREQEIPMEVVWDDGVRFQSRNGDFETKIGGRIFADMLNTWSEGDLPGVIRPTGDFNNRNDQAYLRSSRLSIEGKMYDEYFYNFEYEFNGSINTKTEVDGLRDMNLGMRNIPLLGRVTVGHMKEPFSLEESSSSSDSTFLERSLANVFAPGFSWGAHLL